MSISAHFAADYAEARRKFLDAAREAGADMARYDNPAFGPDGLALLTDVAWLGPRDAANVLMTISATHGAEGFCGSGVQTGWFATGRAVGLPADTALLQVHAINPYGFAWLRRTNEDNIDLNRNFVDFDEPLPRNDAYEKYRDLFCPAEWSEEIAVETAAEIDRLTLELGGMIMQTAFSGGQYTDPEGVFYGGTGPCWSRRTLESILGRYLGQAQRVAVIDYHTGLGPRGYGERIAEAPPGSPGWSRLQAWYGDCTSTDDGSSTSAPLTGTNLHGIERRLAHVEVTAIALEYGTQPLTEVGKALRADNWLHVRGDLHSEQGRRIKRQMRDAFYQDADDWKRMVWERAVDTQERALAGLSAG